MIELNQVTMKFEKEEAVSSVSFVVQKGSAFGLLGANSAGKSTILRLLTGIYKPTRGEMKIEGQLVFDNVEVKRKVFFINDETIAYNHERFGLIDIEYYRLR